MKTILLLALIGAHNPILMPSGGFSGGDLENVDDFVHDAPGTDTAPNDTVIVTQPVYPGVNATNKTGSTLYLGGSTGAINLTGVTKAGTAGDTITFVINKYATPATNTSVTFTEGVTYTCAAAADDPTCVCNLYTAILANATLAEFVNVVRTNATCSDEKLFFGLVKNKSVNLTVTPSDNTNTTVVSSTSGTVRSVYPFLGTTITASGEIRSTGGSILADSSSYIGLYGSSKIGAPFNGQWLFTNDGYTSGFLVKGTTDGLFELRTRADAADADFKAGIVSANTYINAASATRIYLATDAQAVFTDNAVAKGVMLDLSTDGTAHFKTRTGAGGAAIRGASLMSTTGGSTFQASTVTRATTGPTGDFEVFSGAQTNAGNYASGSAKFYTGDTTTDGDTGDVLLYSGVAGAGQADAGDVKMGVHGTNYKFTVDGATGLSYTSIQTLTVVDNGGGTPATATLTPTANVVLCVCEDAHGCTITMGETGMISGMPLKIIGNGANNCTFADTDGLSNLTGAFTMADDDVLELIYAVDEWVEVSRSDN